MPRRDATGKSRFPDHSIAIGIREERGNSDRRRSNYAVDLAARNGGRIRWKNVVEKNALADATILFFTRETRTAR